MKCIAPVLGMVAILAACGSSGKASAAGDVSGSSAGPLAQAAAQVDELKDAQAALDGGHPWRATQIVSPLLRDPARRSPAAVLLAAKAAAGWGGGPRWAGFSRRNCGSTRNSTARPASC